MSVTFIDELSALVAAVAAHDAERAVETCKHETTVRRARSNTTAYHAPTVAQTRAGILATLHAQGNQSTVALGKRLGMHRGTILRRLTELHEEGIVARAGDRFKPVWELITQGAQT